MRCSAVCKPPSQAPQSSWPLFQMRPTSKERPAAWQSFSRTSYFCNKNQKRRGGSGHLWCDQVLGKVAMSANCKKFGLRQPQRTTVLYKSTVSTISLYFLHVKHCKHRKESYCSSSFHLCHLAFHPASGAKVRTASTTLTRLPQVSNLKPTQAEKKWWTIMEPMNWRSQNHLAFPKATAFWQLFFWLFSSTSVGWEQAHIINDDHIGWVQRRVGDDLHLARHKNSEAMVIPRVYDICHKTSTPFAFKIAGTSRKHWKIVMMAIPRES